MNNNLLKVFNYKPGSMQCGVLQILLYNSAKSHDDCGHFEVQSVTNLFRYCNENYKPH